MERDTLHVPDTPTVDNILSDQRIEIPRTIFIPCQRLPSNLVRYDAVLHIFRPRNERRSKDDRHHEHHTPILQYGHLRDGRNRRRYAIRE